MPIGRAFRKYGWDNFQHVILYKDLNEFDAKWIEKKLIELLKTQDDRFGYNICDGGDGSTGWKHSEEVKKLISEMASRRVREANPNYGNHWSEEQRRKASEKKMRKNLSDETLKKMSETARKRVGEKNPFYGKHHSAETKRLLSVPHCKRVKQFDIDGNFIKEYISLKEAGDSVGVCYEAIANCCRGKTNTSAGYKWAFA